MRETSTVLVASQPIATVSRDVIEQLKKMAWVAPLKRARLCLHGSHEDAVQEMVICLHKDTYIRPHRHPNKTESFHMIEGSLVVGFFEESGAIRQTLELHADRNNMFLYRLSASFWHSVVPLTEFAVFQEVANGPFSQAEYPVWEPSQNPDAIQCFKDRIVGVKA